MLEIEFHSIEEVYEGEEVKYALGIWENGKRLTYVQGNLNACEMVFGYYVAKKPNEFAHFLCEVKDEDAETDGEQFLVGARDLRELLDCLFEQEEYCQAIAILSEEEAENSGLDEF